MLQHKEHCKGSQRASNISRYRIGMEYIQRGSAKREASAERDLETKLDWVAVNHYDTDHPHVHIVLRGQANDGRDLIIARNYITHGFRKRAEERATLELGPRRDIDIAKARFRETTQERFTSIDRELLQAAHNGVVAINKPDGAFAAFRAKLLRARLRTLENMNLAERERGG